ncbi:MAG: hypothetical protein IJR58_05625 [Lachnospiraceae bacterium]|nr:hypothetical protein [Lachnospiraceae bacterium]
MEGNYFFIGFVGIFIVATFVIGLRDKRLLQKRLLARIRDNYGKAPKVTYDENSFARIPKYFQTHAGEHALDDITWNDLDMDDVFVRFNYCASAAGEEVLYAMLRNVCGRNNAPAPFGDKEAFEERLTTLSKDKELREALQVAYYRIGKTGKYSVHDYLKGLESLPRGKMGLEIAALCVMVFSVVLMFFAFPLGATLLFATFVYQLLTFYRRKSEIEPYLVCFDYILRMLKEGDTIRALIEEKMQKEGNALREMGREMASFKRGASLVRAGMYNSAGATGSLFDILMDYVNILFHLNLMKFDQMLREVEAHRETIDAMVTLTGMIEAMIAIVCYRASLQTENGAGYCVPEFSSGDAYNVEGLTHPLLGNAVPSDLATKNNILITGSNASGKSTFLKAAALSVVMAQTIHTVTASSYQAPFMRVYSSMALRDDIHGGDSYYMVEIKSLKRVLDAVKVAGAPKVFCCIDEVLRGTNTVERIAASSEILKVFSADNALCIAATHDVELTTLLKGYYENYHFEGIVKDGDVQFDFTLHEGPSTTRNAIALLDLMGYDASITKAAEERAGRFLREGKWE